MAIKISSENLKERLDHELQNDFMRGAVASAQDGMDVKRRRQVDALGNWEEWRKNEVEIPTSI
jgi:L-lactate dehydrogenase complex protein LldF